MFIPYKVDVEITRPPFANYAILLGMLIIFAFFQTTFLLRLQDNPFLALTSNWLPYLLDGWTLRGLLGHMWLHAGIWHVLGNMIFLGVFGNAVCSKVGNAAYPFVYVALGVAAGMTHLVFNDAAAIGASGAINGIVGMFLVFYPLNEVSCLLILFFRFITFSVSSMWIILLWLVFDILGAIWGGGGVAYAAHLGGFAAGVALGVVFLKTGLVRPGRGDRTLLDFLGLGPGAIGKGGSLARGSKPPTATRADQRTIQFRCRCGRLTSVPAEYAGRRARCPACERMLTIPPR